MLVALTLLCVWQNQCKKGWFHLDSGSQEPSFHPSREAWESGPVHSDRSRWLRWLLLWYTGKKIKMAPEPGSGYEASRPFPNDLLPIRPF